MPAAVVAVPAARLAVSPRPSTELAAQALAAAELAGESLGSASFLIVAGDPLDLLMAARALDAASVRVPPELLENADPLRPQELDRPTG